MDIFNDLTQSQQIGLCLLLLFIFYKFWKTSTNPTNIDSETPGSEITIPLGNGFINQEVQQNYHTSWINKGFGYGYGDSIPTSKLLDLIQEFGPPSSFDPESGGGAIWNKNNLTNTPFDRIEIRDEQIPHDIPVKHTDFLYSSHKVEIPHYLIGGVHKISSSILYDPLKKIVTARCHDMRPNVVAHWITKKYAFEEITLDEAVGMYGPMIMELFQNDQNGIKYQQLLSELYD